MKSEDKPKPPMKFDEVHFHVSAKYPKHYICMTEVMCEKNKVSSQDADESIDPNPYARGCFCKR